MRCPRRRRRAPLPSRAGERTGRYGSARRRDEGIPVRTIAEALAARLDLPTTSVEADALGFFGLMQSVDHTATAARTRALLGWEPTHPGLLDDIAAGHYDG